MLVHSFPLLYFCLVQKGIAIENGTTLQMGTRLNPISDVYFNHLWSSNEIRMTEKMVKWKEFVFHSFEYFTFSAMWNSTFFPQGPQKGWKGLRSDIFTIKWRMVFRKWVLFCQIVIFMYKIININAPFLDVKLSHYLPKKSPYRFHFLIFQSSQKKGQVSLDLNLGIEWGINCIWPVISTTPFQLPIWLGLWQEKR